MAPTCILGGPILNNSISKALKSKPEPYHPISQPTTTSSFSLLNLSNATIPNPKSCPSSHLLSHIHFIPSPFHLLATLFSPNQTSSNPAIAPNAHLTTPFSTCTLS